MNKASQYDIFIYMHTNMQKHAVKIPLLSLPVKEDLRCFAFVMLSVGTKNTAFSKIKTKLVSKKNEKSKAGIGV